MLTRGRRIPTDGNGWNDLWPDDLKWFKKNIAIHKMRPTWCTWFYDMFFFSIEEGNLPPLSDDGTGVN